MKKRILKSMTIVLVVISMISATVFAAFPDVDAKKYSWAVDSINSMADAGIIKGYEDGTFNPEKSVSKLEGLVLISRILGCDDSANELLAFEATQIYSDLVSDYDLNFGEKEVAYLLIKGVLTEDELDDYLTGNGAADGLKRYEVATLLTKALDGDEGLATSPSLSYSDAGDIPATAKKYVKFVTDNGLMNGMEDNKFSPNTNVTRAQAAVVLKKLQTLTSYQFRTGTVVDYNSTTGIKVKNSDGSLYTHNIMPNVILRYEGKKISSKDIVVGSSAFITYKDSQLYAIDFITSAADNTVSGVISSVTTSGSSSTITVKLMGENDTEPSDDKKTFTLANDVAIVYNGKSASKSDLTNGKLVVIDVKAGKAKSIEVFDKITNISGTIENIIISPVFKLVVKDNSGYIDEYMLKDVVTVTRGGKEASVSNLASGDMVSLTLEYGVISKVVATTKTNVKSGLISAIYIASSPELTLKIDGADVTYPLSSKTKYIIDGVDKPNIYSLRTNTIVTVDIESETIVKIVTSAPNETKTITGTVISATPAAKVFQVTYTDTTLGTEIIESVVVNDKTTIVDTSGKTKKIADISVSDNVMILGSISSGVISATMITIID